MPGRQPASLRQSSIANENWRFRDDGLSGRTSHHLTKEFRGSVGSRDPKKNANFPTKTPKSHFPKFLITENEIKNAKIHVPNADFFIALRI
jgi:hypothetical protein